jgi:3-hydroxypropanoate dehydrogenase
MTVLDAPALAKGPLSDAALRQLFVDARTYNDFQPTPVPDALLRRLAELVRLGPTAANSGPARFVFVQSAEAKARLAPHLSEGNRAKTLAAPVTAIVGYDLEFYENLPKLFPHNQTARSWFAGKPAAIEETGFRNSSLQGAYMILAARALGLDCGPMSGFDRAGLDAAFFPDGKIKSNFICNLGYGSAAGLFPRSPRLEFEEFCSIA